jgi:protocatechuate 3,4-dioxygenase beta subunit
MAAQRTDRKYEGRALPRPDEELVDQGLAFDVGTLMNRRQALSIFGLGAAAVGLAACGASSSGNSSGASSSSAKSGTDTSAKLTEIPQETAGPYPGDGTNGPDVLEQSGVVRSDIRSSFGSASARAHGVPMTLELTIKDLAHSGQPFEGVAVYVWHCNRDGEYSMYGNGITDQNYLRGVQVADAKGKVRFTSIFPACYDGRWPHIHFEVYPHRRSITDASKAIATSQVALPRATCKKVYAVAGYENSTANLAKVSLDSDLVFGDDGGVHELATVTGSVKRGFHVALEVGVDTRTKPTGQSGVSGGGAPPNGQAPGQS